MQYIWVNASILTKVMVFLTWLSPRLRLRRAFLALAIRAGKHAFALSSASRVSHSSSSRLRVPSLPASSLLACSLLLASLVHRVASVPFGVSAGLTRRHMSSSLASRIRLRVPGIQQFHEAFLVLLRSSRIFLPPSRSVANFSHSLMCFSTSTSVAFDVSSLIRTAPTC